MFSIQEFCPELSKFLDSESNKDQKTALTEASHQPNQAVIMDDRIGAQWQIERAGQYLFQEFLNTLGECEMKTDREGMKAFLTEFFGDSLQEMLENLREEETKSEAEYFENLKAFLTGIYQDFFSKVSKLMDSESNQHKKACLTQASHQLNQATDLNDRLARSGEGDEEIDREDIKAALTKISQSLLSKMSKIFNPESHNDKKTALTDSFQDFFPKVLKCLDEDKKRIDGEEIKVALAEVFQEVFPEVLKFLCQCETEVNRKDAKAALSELFQDFFLDVLKFLCECETEIDREDLKIALAEIFQEFFPEVLKFLSECETEVDREDLKTALTEFFQDFFLEVLKFLGEYEREINREIMKAALTEIYQELFSTVSKIMNSESNQDKKAPLIEASQQQNQAVALIGIITENGENEKEIEEDYQITSSPMEEPYLPSIQLNPTAIFYQSDIPFSITVNGYEYEGKFTGTLGGYQLLPNGLGEWKYKPKNDTTEVVYKGEWQNGLWHGLGNFEEVSQQTNEKIILKISGGSFVKGKLIAEDSCSDAHICVELSLSDRKSIQIHYYGQMKEANGSPPLAFLRNHFFSSNFYFHKDCYRNSFRRVGQLQIVGSGLTRSNGYQVIGEWNDQEASFAKVHENEFPLEIQRNLENLKVAIELILKGFPHCRYSILGFLDLIENSHNDLDFLEKVVEESDDRIVSENIRNCAKNLQEILQLLNRIETYIKLKQDKIKLREDIKGFIEAFVDKDYTLWLKEKSKHGGLPKQITTKNKLLLDPNILEMISCGREEISGFFSFAPDFDMARKPIDTNLVNNFIKAWRDYSSRENLKTQSQYMKGWDIFIQREKQIKEACDQYLTLIKYCFEIIGKTENARKLQKTKLVELYDKIYQSYSNMFGFKNHCKNETENTIVDYMKEHRDQLTNIINGDLSNLLETINNSTIKSLLKEFLERVTKENEVVFHISSILNIFEYITNIANLKINDPIFQEIVKLQLSFLQFVNNFPSHLTRIISLFNSFLSAYENSLNEWTSFFNCKSIKFTLEKINSHIGTQSRLLFESFQNGEALRVFGDFVEKQKNFLVNISYLPLIIKSDNIQPSQFNTRGNQGLYEIKREFIAQFPGVQHCSYQLIEQTLDILSQLIRKYHQVYPNEIVLSFVEKYYDVLGELLKQLDKQIHANDLESEREKKLGHFTHCLKITDLKRLIAYLEVLKQLISIQGNQIEISADAAIREFGVLNRQNRNTDPQEFQSLHHRYMEKFRVFRLLFMSRKFSLDNIAQHLRDIVHTSKTGTLEKLAEGVKNFLTSDKNKKSVPSNSADSEDIQYKGHIKEDLLTLLAGVAWILTAKVSRLTDEENLYNSESGGIELCPHIIQILGCMKFLQLDNQTKTAKNLFDWLSNIPKQVGEILTGQGKSWQISLISMMYALFDFRVTVACYSEYLSSRDEKELEKNFDFMSEEVKKIKFKTLEQLARDEVQGIDSMVRQILYDGKYQESSELPLASNQNNQSFFIIDEVDTLISSQLTQSLTRASFVKNSELANGIEMIYNYAKKQAASISGEEEIKGMAMLAFETEVFKNINMKNLAKNYPDFFKSFKNELWNCAIPVANFYSTNKEKRERGKSSLHYQLDKHGEPLFRLKDDCSHWEYYIDGRGWTNSWYLSYYNAFFYLELFSQQSKCSRTKINIEAYGYMDLPCGTIYYSSVVSKFAQKLMVGVTGSLKERTESQKSLLCDAETQILQMPSFLGVPTSQLTLFPSFFGKSRLIFDPSKKDFFKICETAESCQSEIYQKCVNLANQNKAVLVFLKDYRDLHKLKDKLAVKYPYLLSDDEISINNHGQRKDGVGDTYRRYECDWQASIDRLIGEHCAGQPGSITLATHNYGRGTDFKASDTANKNGGLHVIQTWFSEDPKEEIQVKGRTARNGAPGTYMQILNLEELKTQTFFDSNSSLSIETSYDELRRLAEISIQNRYSELQNCIAKHRTESQGVLNWLNDAKKDRAQKLKNGTPSNIDYELIANYQSTFL